MNKKHEDKERSFKRQLGHWISRVDSKDRSLEPAVRKRKWVLILSALFVLFATSFLWDPMTDLSSNNLDIPNKPGNLDKKTITPTFEMPVDSFELHLKRSIHENISEKK